MELHEKNIHIEIYYEKVNPPRQGKVESVAEG